MGIVLLILILAGYLLTLGVFIYAPLIGFALTLAVSVVVWQVLPITIELLKWDRETRERLRLIWGHPSPSQVDIRRFLDKREVEEFESAGAGKPLKRFSVVEKFDEKGINPHEEWMGWEAHLENVQKDYDAEFRRVIGGLFYSAAFLTVSALYLKEAEDPNPLLGALLTGIPLYVSFNLIADHLKKVLKLRKEVKLFKEWVAYWYEARQAYASEIERNKREKRSPSRADT